MWTCLKCTTTMSFRLGFTWSILRVIVKYQTHAKICAFSLQTFVKLYSQSDFSILYIKPREIESNLLLYVHHYFWLVEGCCNLPMHHRPDLSHSFRINMQFLVWNLHHSQGLKTTSSMSAIEKNTHCFLVAVLQHYALVIIFWVRVASGDPKPPRPSKKRNGWVEIIWNADPIPKNHLSLSFPIF